MQRVRDLLNRNPQSDDELEISIPKVVEPEVHGSLMACKGTTRLTRGDLATLVTPEATQTFQPIGHAMLIDEVEKALAYRHISIVRDDYAVSNDGMKLFALLVLNADYEGISFAIGLRNANDRSMRLGMVAGYQVVVCSNMMFAGEFKPLLAKHSKHFDLVESVSIGVDRIQRGWQPLQESIEFKRTRFLTTDEARVLVYRAFMEHRFPAKLMKTVHREFFIQPSYLDFRQQTVWSLENAFTIAFKELAPVRQYEMTARLGKFLQPYAQAA